MIISILAVVLLFGILVIIHELGHFLAAKRVGVRVEKFSVGFGKKIFSFQYGETEYLLSLIPFGGYVKLTGEMEEEDEKDTDDEKEEQSIISEEPDPRSLVSKTPWERFQVFIAGPLMNLLLAIVVTAFISMIGLQEDAYLSQTPEVPWLQSDSPVVNAGMKPGDLIVSIDGKKVKDWRDVINQLSLNIDQPFSMKVKRNDQMHELNIPTAEKDEHKIFRGMSYHLEPVVDEVLEGEPAYVAGLKPGDKILTLEGHPIDTWYQMTELVGNNAGKELSFQIQRDGQNKTLHITPEADDEGSGKVGIYPVQPTITKRYGIFKSIWRGFSENYKLTVLTFQVLGRLVTGNISPRTLGGPIMIADTTAKVARKSFTKLLGWMSFISLNFFIMNLLPIPVLDGGHIIFLIPEFITGRQLSDRIKMISFQVGFFILIGLMVLISFNDIMRLMGY